MELTFNRVDLAAVSARQPSDLVTRGHINEVWYVPFSPLVFDKPSDWRHYRREQHVVIPLFPYCVPPGVADALGFAFQLGVNALHQLGGKPVKRLHLSLGEPVDQVYNEDTGHTTWLFHLGVGIVFE